MQYNILSKRVLNENTGELETLDFKQLSNKQSIKGGYSIMYHKSYEQITEEVLNSNKDVKLFNWIVNRFTYTNNNVELLSSDYKDVSQPTFSKMIKKLIDVGFLKRVGRGIYRMNPYVYLPYKADGLSLQKEWNEL